METHVKVLGWLYIISAIFEIMIGACTAVVIFAGGQISGDSTAMTVTSIVAAVIGGILLFWAIPGIIAGIGLIKIKNWARILAIILGVLSLPAFPIGTALGVYTLIVLLHDDTSLLFTSQ